MLKNLKTAKVEINGVRGIEKFTFTSPLDGVEDFALALAPKHASKTGIWIVNLHGHGSNGDQLFTRKDMKDTWLPAMIDGGYGILAPNLRGNSWMSEAAAKDLQTLLRLVRERYGVKGFIFVGGSMGGTSCLIYASLHPEDVMACVALCPATDLPSYREFCGKGGMPILNEIAGAIDAAYPGGRNTLQAHSALVHADALKMPLFIAHATSDPTIPVEQSRRLAKAMTRMPDFKYREIPGGHNSPLPLMPEGLKWVTERLQKK